MADNKYKWDEQSDSDVTDLARMAYDAGRNSISKEKMSMNKKSGCELVRNGVIRYAPRNYKDNGRPNCYGYINRFKDTELAECKKCPWFYLRGGD